MLKANTFSLLPPSSTTPNGTLLCNGKPARDRNRKVAPMITVRNLYPSNLLTKCWVAEAGHLLKTLNSRWLTMLDILYAEKLCIHDWPAGVPPPGPDFDLKALSASQLCVMVAPYLRIHLGAMYEAKLGLDDDDDDSKAEAAKAKAKKHKGKPKKSGDKGRKKGPTVQEPSVVLHISGWPESDIIALETQATNMCLIPLVFNTDGRVVHSLQDSEKFVKDLPQDNTVRHHTNQEAPHLCHPTDRVFEELPPSSPPTPSSQFSSPPPISRQSSPVPPLDYSHIQDTTYSSCSRYKCSHEEALRYQHPYDDVMPTYNPDTRKRTRPRYESAWETEDLEREMVEERHHARVHDNSRILSGQAQSQAHSLVKQSISHPIYFSYNHIHFTPSISRGMLKPEDKSVWSMDVDSDIITIHYCSLQEIPSVWSMDVDLDVIMVHEIPSVWSMVVDSDVETPLKPEEGSDGCMNVDGDVIMEILKPEDE
ncbi:hypothetical protein DFJ58DRAFT_845910 [Suillus subalutaceus]|uniref:uncharacterized protein n=1 Tax=Suillus subalutaceus TaxID=48586 RepID=UPI001B87916F|nr:uncharacterized protein DFJ58DRAFT_845910 [Suillus subalutaceus]KAG1838868.1 hypothetical protein DFJ58DRAFT_845910 [Suillus subalutaceus]